MKESNINFLQEEIKLEPNNPFNYYLLALELKKENRIDEAEEEFIKILNQFPDYLPIYLTFLDFKIAYPKTNLKIDLVKIGEMGIKLAKNLKNEKAQRELQAFLDIHF